MARELQPGVSGIGRVFGVGEEAPYAQFLIDEEGAILSRVRYGEPFGALVEDAELPHQLAYLDTDGPLVFGGLRRIGPTMSSNGMTTDRWRAHRLILPGQPEVDFSRIHGMSTEIDGLGSWCSQSAITFSLRRIGDGSTPEVSITGKEVESIALGGSPHLVVSGGFRTHPRPADGVYWMADIVLCRSLSDKADAWEEHATVHQMAQDVICLAYGAACAMKLRSVMHMDDQAGLDLASDRRRFWRDAYEPSLGRNTVGLPREERKLGHPLFSLPDINRAALEAWLADPKKWARPTSIAVSTLFASGAPAESNLIQMGVALEALGYALWLEAQEPQRPSRAPSFPALLKFVTDAAMFDEIGLHRTLNAAQWRRGFNAAFKGAKHADNARVDPHRAHLAAEEAFLLVRVWLAVRLGMPRSTLADRLAATNQRMKGE